MHGDRLVFVDSNVLLYSLDSRNLAKQRIAREWLDVLWSSDTGRLSWQVLNEYYANAAGKMGASPMLVRASVELFAAWSTTESTMSLLRRAWHWVDEAGLNYWDSLILAAAEQAGCAYLLSEDFQTGRKFGAITVINPFQHAPKEFLG